ncbi:MAG: hypothetical protein RBT15_02330 [Gudongella sp.]|nr:hypothetical protein [Gudongella sp.]
MFIPLGIGIIIAAVLLNLAHSVMLKADVETRARAMGMVYPGEEKVLEAEHSEVGK